MNLIDYINLAEREAFKRHIRTNSVMINKELLLIDEGRIATNQYYSHIPPMICGLWAFVTDELPEEIAFCAFEGKTMPDDILQRCKNEARQELIEELLQMTAKELIDYLSSWRINNESRLGESLDEITP